jgi:gamma-D-glutamyl-L-lysine dipeptidyl-peptidase
MAKAICIVPVAPMRSTASHASEQVSQLVFGEVCEVNDTSGDFSFVTCLYDGYRGWCQTKQLELANDEQAYFPTVLIDRWASTIQCNEQPMQLPMGSNIGFLKNGHAHFGALKFHYDSHFYSVPLHPDLAIFKQAALSFINTPYLWGGRTVFGVDCSGFTQMVYKFCGVPLLRDASQQATQGEVVDFLQEVVMGDLAFFDNEDGKITHVGIMLDNKTIIHASGKVRIDAMDQAGIINGDNNQRTHKLRIIKRVVQ